MKDAAKFTRDQPVTKVELWNCFTDATGQWRARSVVEAKSEIGDNAPKYLKREGFMEEQLIGGVDTYILTWRGKGWLRSGTVRYLELHPERIADCRNPPRRQSVAGRVLRRTRG